MEVNIPVPLLSGLIFMVIVTKYCTSPYIICQGYFTSHCFMGRDVTVCGRKCIEHRYLGKAINIDSSNGKIQAKQANFIVILL